MSLEYTSHSLELVYKFLDVLDALLNLLLARAHKPLKVLLKLLPQRQLLVSTYLRVRCSTTYYKDLNYVYPLKASFIFVSGACYAQSSS